MQKVKNVLHFLQAAIANLWYVFPARGLTIIGVTGTSGKTTTAHMIYHLLKTSGKSTALISSVAAYIGDQLLDTGFHVTTPDPWVLPRYLKIASAKGIKYLVLEVSSHGLDQNRVAFIPFTIGVLTTLAHEHLDYHKHWQNYAKAKFKLINRARWAVLPTGLEEYAKLISRPKKTRTFGYGKAQESPEKWHFKLRLLGEYNLLNALATAAVGEILGIKREVIRRALESFTGLPGRFEEVYHNDFRVIIDFAHKPDALEALLKAVRNKYRPKRIIVLYGCASERDTLKRPMMGEISGRLADITVLTDEDPRREDPLKIINEIASGCLQAGAVEQFAGGRRKLVRQLTDGKHYFFKIPNRQTAINFIVQKLAQKDDVILLCGKGHEKSMNYNGIERPWSEHAAIKKALSLRRS